jgi:hypothetical protein
MIGITKIKSCANFEFKLANSFTGSADMAA